VRRASGDLAGSFVRDAEVEGSAAVRPEGDGPPDEAVSVRSDAVGRLLREHRDLDLLDLRDRDPLDRIGATPVTRRGSLDGSFSR
jgi:hypothetical protein